MEFLTTLIIKVQHIIFYPSFKFDLAVKDKTWEDPLTILSVLPVRSMLLCFILGISCCRIRASRKTRSTELSKPAATSF